MENIKNKTLNMSWNITECMERWRLEICGVWFCNNGKLGVVVINWVRGDSILSSSFFLCISIFGSISELQRDRPQTKEQSSTDHQIPLIYINVIVLCDAKISLKLKGIFYWKPCLSLCGLDHPSCWITDVLWQCSLFYKEWSPKFSFFSACARVCVCRLIFLLPSGLIICLGQLFIIVFWSKLPLLVTLTRNL
jgi:hypothetical protein